MKLYVPPIKVFPWDATVPLEAGDVLLVRHKGIVPALIRLFERLRKPRGVPRATWNAACRINHACIVVVGSPAIVAQATAKGIVLTPVAELVAEEIEVIRFTAADNRQLAAARRFAHDTVGDGYGYLQIVADAFNALTGLELSLGIGTRMVCSTQTCRTVERFGLIPDRTPEAVTPAHLAWYFSCYTAR